MTDINETFAQLRKSYPDDESIKRIEADEKRMTQLLEEQEYYENPGTQKLIAQCRIDINTARLKLATEKAMEDETRAALWAIIDARHWFLKLVVKNYQAELQTLAEELQAQLDRAQ